MPTEMELTLEQTQQGVSHEVSIHLKSPSHYPCEFCQNNQSEFITMKMEILLESTSNKLMVVNEIDQDEGISWFQEDSETQGRYGYDIGVNTASTSIITASINITIVEHVTTASVPITTVGVSVSTAEPSTPPTMTTNVIEDKDLIIAQTLMKMRCEKSKEKSKEKGVSRETATRLARGVIVKEASETAPRPTVPPPQIDPKDKGKGIMQEPEKPVKVKGKDQIEYDADVAQRLQAELDEEAMLEREREEEASKAANIAEWDYVPRYDGCRL
ncbi:hypothetical protein Tco_0040466 [Tanacetum coccineum]